MISKRRAAKNEKHRIKRQKKRKYLKANPAWAQAMYDRITLKEEEIVNE